MKRGLLALLTAAPLLLGGCAAPGSAGGSLYSNYRDIEDLQLVRTMGFDGGLGRMQITVSSVQGQSQSPTVLLSAQGAGIASAAGKLQDWAAQEELFFAHTQYVLVGEETAREGLTGILDYFERDTRTRLDLPLFIVRDGTAAELIAGAGVGDYEITEVLSALRRDAEKRGSAYCFSLMEIAQRLSRSGAALCCAVTAAPLGGNVPSDTEDTQTALEAGYAVLRGGALAGFLDREVTQGVNLLLDKAGTESIVLTHNGTAVTVDLEEGRTEITPRWDNRGHLQLQVRMEYQAGITELSRGSALDEAGLTALEESFSRFLADRADAALGSARALDADFLEIGRLVQRADPVRFAAMSWEGFPDTVTWEIQARGTIARSYDLLGSADVEGEGRDHV